MELAEHEIAAVAPEVAPVGRVLRRRQVERRADRALGSSRGRSV